MLPHNHFLIAISVILPVAIVLVPEKSGIEIGKWLLAGGLISSAIDLDAYFFVLLKSRREQRLRPFRNPLEIYRKFGLFMDTIAKTGILRICLKTHTLISMFAVLMFYFFGNDYLIPVVLGAASHLISDIPNLRHA